MLRRVTFLAVAILLLVSCRREAKTPKFANAPVIFISVDTLRADRLPGYGYTKVETPNIDAFRRDGILYLNAYAHCPMTLPSHVSILSGLLPTENEVRNNLGYRFDAEKHETLPQLLHRDGYATGAAVSSFVLRADTGLGRAFDFYDDAIPVSTAGAASQHQRSGRDTLAVAKRWLDANDSKPFFFMFHIYEPHAPYDPPEPFKSRYSAEPYDGEVATADAITGDFLHYLKERGVYDRAIIVFLSDHGEGLWEHGEDQHGILLYREVLRVPLIVKLPKSASAGASVAAPVELIDLFPTIADLLGVASPKGLKGISITSLLDGNAKPPERRIYGETFYPRIHLGWSELRSLIDARYHYIASPKPELYDVVRDPTEKSDVIASDRRIASSMREELNTYPAGIKELASVDPEEQKKLAALGYIGSVHSTADAGPLPNPKDMLPYLARIKAGFKLADERRYEEAVKLLEALVRENPRLFDAWDKLGELLVDMGRYDEAIRVYREAMSRAQRFSPEMALSLGDAYLQAGKPDEAARYADLAMTALPANAHGLLARVAMAKRDFATAEREARAAAGETNPQPAAMLLIAEVKKGAGDLRGALAALEAADARAKALNVPKLYRLDFLRGDVLARLGREAEAVDAYRREIANFPDDTKAYANLAIIYFLEEQPAEVNRLLEQMVTANPHPGAYALAAHTLETLGDTRGASKWSARAKQFPRR